MTLTVRALKEMLDGWPEETEDGEPTEVWIETVSGYSDAATNVEILNKRVADNGYQWYDMLISTLND